MIVQVISVSAIIPTKDRTAPLLRTLESLTLQSSQPAEIIVIDASEDEMTKNMLNGEIHGLKSTLVYQKANTRGAASQRNEGVAIAKNPYIFFMDDDLLFEPECIDRLFKGIESDPELGGVNAMITNQKYLQPGKISSILFRYLNGTKLNSYAGKCLGPVVNLLPEDREDLPEVVRVEWLNSGCTIYRRDALPNPPFPSFFTGYSMFEDVTVSSNVGRTWKLANVRTARVYHDSQPGDYKKSIYVLSKMELVNRYYVMTRVLNRRGISNLFRLMLVELYKVSSYFKSIKLMKVLPLVIAGKCKGVLEIITHVRNVR